MLTNFIIIIKIHFFLVISFNIHLNYRQKHKKIIIKKNKLQPNENKVFFSFILIIIIFHLIYFLIEKTFFFL